MSNTQIILSVLAMLSMYALAAKLDESAASTVDRAWVRLSATRCMPPARHPTARNSRAASEPAQTEPSSRIVC